MKHAVQYQKGDSEPITSNPDPASLILFKTTVSESVYAILPSWFEQIK